MALFYHGLNQTELALRHMSRTLLLLSLASGPSHPDVAATLINVAMMYQDAGNTNTSLRYLQEALMKNERLLGPDHIQTAVCYHALAIAFNCVGAYKLSIQVSSDLTIFRKEKMVVKPVFQMVDMVCWFLMPA
jgi:protein TIF31